MLFNKFGNCFGCGLFSPIGFFKINLRLFAKRFCNIRHRPLRGFSLFVVTEGVNVFVI
jgi:hypothetical protein